MRRKPYRRLLYFVAAALLPLALISGGGCWLQTNGLLFNDGDAGPDAGGSGGGGGNTASCGNNVREGTEPCDGTDLAGQNCKTIPGGYVGGDLACKACKFDVNGCTPPPSCGDGDCNNNETCSSCQADCGQCCGNNNLDPNEDCDGDLLGGATCASVLGVGYDGTLGCAGDCTYLTTLCTPPASCGNGTKESGEACDGADLGVATCLSVPGGYTAGLLSCNANCTLNDSACTKCGNNNKESGETCDGLDLSGKNCTTVPGGFTDGTLACKGDCSGYDTSGCTTCGNNNKESGETCDGLDLSGKNCTTVPGGFTAGTLACKGDCSGYVTSGCTTCGNNSKEPGETCDGIDLSGKDCTTIVPGFSGGTLGCQGDCSGYNTSGCLLPGICDAGSGITVDQITGSGTLATGFFIHFALPAVTPDFYLATSTTKSFTGMKLPGQFILAGQDGVSFTLYSGGNPIAKPWYRITAMPTAECTGAIQTQTCLTAVAKAWRCQHTPPYADNTGCPAPVTFTAKPAASTVNDSAGVGWQAVLVDLADCP